MTTHDYVNQATGEERELAKCNCCKSDRDALVSRDGKMVCLPCDTMIAWKTRALRAEALLATTHSKLLRLRARVRAAKVRP